MNMHPYNPRYYDRVVHFLDRVSKRDIMQEEKDAVIYAAKIMRSIKELQVTEARASQSMFAVTQTKVTRVRSWTVPSSRVTRIA